VHSRAERERIKLCKEGLRERERDIARKSMLDRVRKRERKNVGYTAALSATAAQSRLFYAKLFGD
jgi:hypothetical protein